MKIGIPREIENNENRASCAPAGIFAPREVGHEVYVEISARAGNDFLGKEYEETGARVRAADEVSALADLTVKVEEHPPREYRYLREGQSVLTYLYTANDEAFTNTLLGSKTTTIAYEAVHDRKGEPPLLTPMSEVAGCTTIRVGATMLQKNNGGRGLLLGEIPNVSPAKAVVTGGSIVGLNTAKIACGLNAIITIFDINADRVGYVDDISEGTVHAACNNEYDLHRALRTADLVVGAVLVPGAKAPKVVIEDMIRTTKPRSIVVDMTIDQGGCTETNGYITTHDGPHFERYGVMHYSVADMPGVVPRTSMITLPNATLPYILKLTEGGVGVLEEDAGFPAGLSTCKGHITYQRVNNALQLSRADPMELLWTQKR